MHCNASLTLSFVCIPVVDGDNLSRYDEDSEAALVEQDQDDGQTLHQLEWELASETGKFIPSYWPGFN